jgi:methylmalonyl-CoA mutase
MPVFGTMAARFNDDGVTALYQALKPRLAELGLPLEDGRCPQSTVRHSTNQTPVVPAARTRYLAEISDTVRGYKKRARAQASWRARVQQLKEAARMLKVDKPDRAPAAEAALDLAGQRKPRMDKDALHLLKQWPDMQRPMPATSTW